jgi:hypothetical protein
MVKKQSKTRTISISKKSYQQRIIQKLLTTGHKKTAVEAVNL